MNGGWLAKAVRRGAVRVVAQTGLRIIGCLPFRVAHRLGGWLGVVAYWLCVRERLRTQEHLRCSFGDTLDQRARDRMAREVWCNAGWTAVETAFLQWPARIFKVARVEIDPLALDRFQALRARGKGVIFASAHIGNWELFAAAVADVAQPLNVVVKRLYDPYYDRWIDRLRRRCGYRVLYTETTDTMEMLRCLKRNETLGILVDQRMGDGDVAVPFFGRLAATAPGFASLALATGAGILCGGLVREGEFRYRVVAGEPVFVPEHVRGYQERRDWLLLAVTREIEALVRRYPTQWMWMTPRWRVSPELAVAQCGDGGAVEEPAA